MISTQVQKAVESYKRSVIPEDPAVACRLVQYWHRRVYAAAGAASFTFFNEAKAKFVTNMAKPNEIPGGHVLLARSLRVRVLNNHVFATGLPTVAAATYVASVDPATNAQQLLDIYNNGQWEFKVAGRVWAEGYGLNKLGAGNSPIVNVSGDVGAAAATLAVANVQNGTPSDENGWKFTPVLVIPEGNTFEMNVEFLAALPLTQAGVVEVALEGVLVGPANA
ncbi:MAG: hypothetical protein IT436_05185 [Phycisphaerales bacterium]|nr:hypothetical protein [Phycisphaerales bacterium]